MANKFIIVTANNYYGMKGYPVVYQGPLDNPQFFVAQSGMTNRICCFKTADAAERIRRTFRRPSDFMVKEV